MRRWLFLFLVLLLLCPSWGIAQYITLYPVPVSQGGTGVTTSTGTGSVVLSTSPTLTTPTVTGAVTANGFVSNGTKFTITGCGADTTVGGATAGTFISRTTGACTVIITLNGATGLTAPTGWACQASDRTTPANLISQSASTATTCTITGTTATGDVLDFLAMGY